MKFRLVLLLTALSAISALGQELKSVVPQHKAGDSLSYRVEFDGDVNFRTLQLGFYHVGEPPKDQPGLTTSFGIDHFTKVKAGVYDVGGIVPENLVEGPYELRAVNASIGPSSKQYSATDLKVTFRIQNDAKYDYPPLKSVTPK